MGVQIDFSSLFDLFPSLGSAPLESAKAALSLAKTFLPLMDDGPSYALLVPWLNRPNLFGLSKLIPLPLKPDYSLSDSLNPTSSPFAFLFPSLIFKTPTPSVT